jgi:hypothetical protein
MASPEHDSTETTPAENVDKPNLLLSLKTDALDGAVISTPTQEDNQQLMRILECSGLLFYKSRRLPTASQYWDICKEQTCVRISLDVKNLTHGSQKFYSDFGKRLISTQEFYNSQGIDAGQIQHVNDWFDHRD